MTKKDYELIAGVMQKIVTNYEGEDWTPAGVVSLAAHHLANKLELENPRFNRSLFLKACGVN